MKIETWLIGAGQMAQDHLKVLNALAVPVTVIARSKASAEKFSAITGHQAHAGGVSWALDNLEAPKQAVVAVNIENLASVAAQLIEAGTQRILLEKPGALDRNEIRRLDQLASARGASVLIGYNRRFHAATYAARQMMEADGGATSCNFEFTEWAHTITPLQLDQRVKQHWLMGNSSHVVDLAFHLCGLPAEWSCFHGGSMEWHKKAARFSGAGITQRGVFFNYGADWEAPGRWGVEVMTRARRFIFRPLEKLQVTPIASVKVELLELDYSLDERFKPGLYRQTEAFLNGVDENFCTLTEQASNFDNYYRMAGY
jgi:hypothetical protein